MIEFVDKTLAQIDWDSRNELRSYYPNGAIIVMGAGGLGWWTVAGLLRCEDITNKFIIYDEDNFVGGNGKKRLPIPANETTRKVNELAGWLTEWMFTPVSDRVSVKNYKFTNASIYNLRCVALILDCTDAPISSRNAIYEAAWEAGIPVLRGSYDGEMVTFGYRPPDSVVDDGGYNLVPNMAVTFAAAGMVAESVRRFLRGEVVKPFTYHFGPVWRSATGNENEQEEIQNAIGQAIEQELSLNEQIQQAIDEGDPLVISENGEILGRLSEFEVEEEEAEEEVSNSPITNQVNGSDVFEAVRREIFGEMDQTQTEGVQLSQPDPSFQSAMNTMLQHALQAIEAGIVGDGREREPWRHDPSPISQLPPPTPLSLQDLARIPIIEPSIPLDDVNYSRRFFRGANLDPTYQYHFMPHLTIDSAVPENLIVLRSPSGDEVVYHLPEGEPDATNDE